MSTVGNTSTGIGIGVDTGGNPWFLAVQPNSAWRNYNAVAEKYSFYTSSSSTTGVFILNNGNVGFGIINPSYPLQVYGAGSSSTAMINTYTTTTTGTIGFQHTNGTATLQSYVSNTYTAWGTSTNHPLEFYVNNNNPQFIIYPSLWNNLICPNTINTTIPNDWQGGTLFTQVASSGTRTPGLMVGYSSTISIGYIISLQPSVIWIDLTISAGSTSVNYLGTLCSYTNASGWINVSDQREKTNISLININNSLEKVLACKPITYNRVFYLDDSGNDIVPVNVKTKPLIGLLAQDQLEINPECVSTWKKEDGTERYGIQYNDYIIHLIGAVQKQNTTITALQTTVQDLTDKINSILAKYPI